MIVEIIEFVKDGVTYIRELYDNGMTVEYVKSDIEPLPTPEPPEPTDTDIVMLAIADLYSEVVAGNVAQDENNNAVMLALADLYEQGMI